MGSLPLSSSSFFLFVFFPFPAGKSPPCPSGLFFLLKTSARNRKAPVRTLSWWCLHRVLWGMRWQWGGLLAPRGTDPRAGLPAWHGSSSPHPAVPAQARLPTAPLCIPTADVSGRAAGLLCTPQACRGRQAALGSRVTPQPLLGVLEGQDADPLPARVPLWGNGNLSEGCFIYFSVGGGDFEDQCL